MSIPLRSLALALLLVVAACGGGGGGPGDPGSTLPALMQSFCARASPGWCGWQALCYPSMQVRTPDECAAATLARCDAAMTEVAKAYRAGHLAWDEDAATSCLAGLEGRLCGHPIVRACEHVFDPQVDPGAECEPPAGFPWMIVDPCVQERCPSACGARCPVPAAIGLPCPDFLCEQGAYCNSDEQPSTCRAILPQGATCSSATGREACGPYQYCAQEGGSGCTSTSPDCTCQPRLVEGAQCSYSGWDWACRSGVCASERCVTPQYTVGATCVNVFGCNSGLFCDAIDTGANGAGWEMGTCRPVRGQGASCRLASDCASGLLCRTGGTCRPPATVGQDCRFPDAGRVDCGIGLVCESGACVAAPSTAGASCAAGTCYGHGLVCSFDQWPGKCVPASQQIRCGFDQPCGPGYLCSNDYDQGTCSPEGIVGAFCVSGSDCDSGICGDDLTCVEACAAG